MPHVFVTRVQEGIPLEGHRHALPSWELSRLERLGCTRRRKASALGYLAVLALASRSSKAPLELARTEGGKPFFANSDRVHFSISHSRDHVACALSEGGIGIDLEDTSRDFSGIAGHLLSRRELARYRELPPIDRNRFACTIWTLKEALGKYRGCGLGYDLRSTSFSLPDHPHGGTATLSGETGGRPLFFRTSPVGEHYLLSVCCEDPTPLTWEYKSPKELLEAGERGLPW